MRPTSASSMFAFTCIFVRSAARMNKRGRLHAGGHCLADVDAALRDDAVDRRRDDRVIEIDLVLIEDACDWLTAALAWFTVASCEASAACAVSTAIFAASRSLCGSSFFAASSFARVYFCCASVSCDLRRLEVALRLGEIRLRLLAGSRCACCSCASNRDGSSFAITCPFLTIELKSAPEPRDVPRHLAADLHRRDGLERAGRADRVDDVAAGDGRRVHLDSEPPRRT